MKNQSASIKNLEVKMGQLYNLLANRAQGAFPSDTEKNLREQANAITLRSGMKYDKTKVKDTTTEVVKQKDVTTEKEKKKVDDEKALLKKGKEKERARV